MKSILLIVASLFAFNENVDFYAKTNDMFDLQFASFNTIEKAYIFNYDFVPGNLTENEFNSFKNGSSYLYYEIQEAFKVDVSRNNLFYIAVDGQEYEFGLELGHLTENYYSIPNFFVDMEYDVISTIEISVPTTFVKAITNYQQRFESSILYTREALKQKLLNANNYEAGYDAGMMDGYEYAWQDAYDFGYSEGLLEGSNESSELNSLFYILSRGFNSIASILSIQLFPGFSLGLLLFMPIIFGIAYFLLKLLIGGR